MNNSNIESNTHILTGAGPGPGARPRTDPGLWVEDQVQRDTTILRKTVDKMQEDYSHSETRFATNSAANPELRENKAETTEFFAQFFKTITETELEVYNQITLAKWNNRYRSDSYDRSDPFDRENIDNYKEDINFKIERIKSAADQPRPQMLESLRHQYDNEIGRSNKHSDSGDTSSAFKFMPKPIYTYIRDKSEWWIQFRNRINGRDVTLHFITFPESKISICPVATSATATVGGGKNQMCAQEIAIYQTYAYKAFLWLTIVSKIADSECSGKSLNVYFYMTPFRKNIPAVTPSTREGDTLSAIHVNTGVTQNCQENGEIIIYRFEEWFKVFIHETMHNFNMDFIETDLSQMNQHLRDAFYIPRGDILLFETYTETWARIIHTMFDAYFDPNVRNQTSFIHLVREKLKLNAIFSVFQLTKVLELMELKYAELTIRSKENELVCRERYKEDSNIYAYYILGGLLSVYALPFISWCMRNNQHNSSTIRNSYKRNRVVDSIRFQGGGRGGGGSLLQFVDFMKNSARDSQMLTIVAFCEKRLDAILKSIHRKSTDLTRIATTLRMTI
jgi:hypothetical protein